MVAARHRVGVGEGEVGSGVGERGMGGMEGMPRVAQLKTIRCLLVTWLAYNEVNTRLQTWVYEDPSAGRTSDKPTTSGHQGLRAWVGQVGPVCPSRPAASSVGRRSVCPSALLGGPCTPPPLGSLEGDGLLSGAAGTAAWDNRVLSSYGGGGSRPHQYILPSLWGHPWVAS